MENIILDPVTNAYPNQKFAGFGIRLLAWIIDLGIFTGISYLIWKEEIITADDGIFRVHFNDEKMLIPFVYFLISWVALSTSLGKMVCGLKIVNENGGKITFIQALI